MALDLADTYVTNFKCHRQQHPSQNNELHSKTYIDANDILWGYNRTNGHIHPQINQGFIIALFPDSIY